MSRPPRPLSAAAPFAAALALLLPASAAGQDLDEILRGVKKFREFAERFEELEDRLDRERDRPRGPGPNVPPQDRPPRPDVNPAAPPGAGPPGLYGPAPGPPYGPSYGSGPPYGPSSPYNPNSDPRRYDPRGGNRVPQAPPGQGGPGQGAPGLGASPGPSSAAADGTTYLMRNPGVRPGIYVVDGAPGGAVRVQVLDENDGFGRGPRRDGAGRDESRRAAEADAADAQAGAILALQAMFGPLRDLRYGLSWFPQESLNGSVEDARRVAQLTVRVEDQLRAAAKSLRPSTVAFATRGSWAPPERGALERGVAGADRLAGWTDADWAVLEGTVRPFDEGLGGLTAAAEPKGAWLEIKTRQLGRLHARFRAALERLRAARGRLRRPGIGPRPGGAEDRRPIGGEDRLRLYALAVRLTEKTADLRAAVARDPLLPLAAAPADDTVRPLDAAERADAAALALAAALAEGAEGRIVSAADAAFEAAWADWNAARGPGRRPTGAPVRDELPLANDATAGEDDVATAANAVHVIHEALHAVVR